MTPRTRLILAGTGRFGQEHLSRLVAMPDVDVVAVADVHEPTVRAVAARFGVARHGTDAAALINELRPEGVVVASSGASHLDLAACALERGIPVLVEKPVTTTVAEAARLLQLEAASTAFVLPGHVLRFSTAHRRLVEIVRSGAIGRVLSIVSRRLRDDSHATRYRDVDPVLMTMIHDIDLALWISGAARAEVHAARATADDAFRSVTTALARDDTGASWTLSTAWTFPADAVPPDRVEVIGSNGGVELEDGSHLRVWGGRDERIDLAGGPADDPLRNELAAFVEAIRSGSAPTVVTTADAERGLRIAAAILADLERPAP